MVPETTSEIVLKFRNLDNYGNNISFITGNLDLTI